MWYLEQLEQLEQLERQNSLKLTKSQLSRQFPFLYKAQNSVLFLCHFAHYHAKFVGSFPAEILEGKLLCVSWTVESRVECSVGFAVDVDKRTLIHVRISLYHLNFLLAGVVLDEREVVFAIACDGTVQVFSDSQAARLACHQLEVNSQLRIREQDEI